MATFNRLSASYCDKCGSVLVKRNGPFGEFFGCSDFPKCRGSKQKFFQKQQRFQRSFDDPAEPLGGGEDEFWSMHNFYHPY